MTLAARTHDSHDQAAIQCRLRLSFHQFLCPLTAPSGFVGSTRMVDLLLRCNLHKLLEEVLDKDEPRTIATHCSSRHSPHQELPIVRCPVVEVAGPLEHVFPPKAEERLPSKRSEKKSREGQ